MTRLWRWRWRATVWNGKPGLPEFLFCEVVPKRASPIFFGVVYRPPYAPFVKGTDLFPSLRDLISNYKVIFGDFNPDQLYSSEDAKLIRSFITENSLFSVPFGATHHTKSSDTWLDLCLVDALDTVLTYWKTDCPFIAGHDLIMATLDIHIPTPQISEYTYRDFKSVDSTALNDYLQTCDWTAFNDDDLSLEGGLQCIYTNLNAALDVFAPRKVCGFKKGRHPWFTAHHRRLLAESDRLYRRYRRSRLESELYDYRAARDLAHEQIEIARLDFYWHRLSGLTDPALIWKELRHLGVASSPSSDSSNFSAEDLNAHFASVSFDAAAPSLSHFLDALEGRDAVGCFDFVEVSPTDVLRAIRRSDSQAVGVDGLPLSFITAAAPSVVGFICRVFNESLSSSTFPDRWKQSVVIALNKVPTPGCLGDFRPISLLCFLSKVLERLVHEQMASFVESRGLLDEFQSGFRPGYSTETAMIKLTDDIRLGRDRRLLTALVLFDFSKAFDSVCHLKLLQKLDNLGFSPRVLKWVASYLGGRSQAVRSSGSLASLTSFRPLNKGVPQGSVLGPLLFILFINDISEGLGSGVRHIVYADDLQVYVQGEFADINSTLHRLSAAAERVSYWAERNGLSVNLSKTKAIVFGTAVLVNRFNDHGLQSLSVGGVDIPFVSSVRSLGIVLDSKLDWKQHVAYICKRANALFYRLNFFRRSTDFRLRKHLAQALLFPLVDYCSLVYCDLSKEQDLIIQRVLNRGVRYVCGVSKFDHVTPHRRNLGWLTALGRRNYFAACMLYRLLNTGIPSYLARFFIIGNRGRPTRGELRTLVVPAFRTESLRKSFHVSTTYLWNSLPAHLLATSSFPTFKHLIKNHIFALEGEQPGP